jgi:hypothetical protein
MHQQTEKYSEGFSEKFSIASLLYIRLRRATSRVVDVMYVSENEQYAEYVVQLALATDDLELHELAKKLQQLLPKVDEAKHLNKLNHQSETTLQKVEPTDEDVYREQVSHHYIGSLR